MKPQKYNEEAAVLYWDKINYCCDIGKWTLYYLDQKIEGRGYLNFINAAGQLSEDINVVFVKDLKYFIHISQNFTDYIDKHFFGILKNGQKDFLTVNITDNIELRNADKFWDDVNGEEFLGRLEDMRQIFKCGCKNRLGLKRHFKCSLSKDMWEDEKSSTDSLYFGAQWSKKFCEKLLPQDEDEYEHMYELNKGSFYYYNRDYFGSTITNVHCYDIHSSHLSFLARKKFPSKRFIRTKDKDEIANVITSNHYCYYGLFAFKTLQYKIEFPINLPKFGFPIPGYQCSWALWLTNVDIENWVNEVFTWEDVKVLEFYYTEQKELEKNYAVAFDTIYLRKKKAEKGTFEKEIYKFRAELPFGQGLKPVEYTRGVFYNNKEKEFYIDDNPEIGFDEIKRRLIDKGIPYYVSAWVAAYSRAEEFNMIYSIGLDKVMYGDTDSVKFIGEEGIKVIEEHNKEILEEYMKISKKRVLDQCVDFELGQWGEEPFLACFKAIGIKWYLTEDFDGNLEVKAAGANVDALQNFLEKQPAPFRAFERSMKVPKLFHRIGYADRGKNGKYSIIEKYLDKMDDEIKKEISGEYTMLWYYKYGQEDMVANG